MHLQGIFPGPVTAIFPTCTFPLVETYFVHSSCITLPPALSMDFETSPLDKIRSAEVVFT